ncbi:mitochondrial 37S ribosomal protein uS9m [Apiospora aurea]|uniref:Small ribosomal subunit protein uS9m n=1 Tax=Apiospora aurea TaxID=335848 RepID=A0ABR1QYG6_9PEZI
MSSLRTGFRCLRDIRQIGKVAATAQWQPTSKASLAYRPKQAINATRSITTTAPRLAETTTTEIIPSDLEPADQDQSAVVQVPYARAVPVSPSYFSRKPIFNDAFVIVQDLARKYARLPIIPRDKVTPTAWRTKEQYRLAVGEHVKGRDYATCMKLAKRLNQIHPDLMPEEVTAGLLPFKREVNYYLNQPKIQPIDQYGRSHGVGKRKSSVARAWVVEGTGEVLVNGKPLSEAFGRVHDRESAVWGMKLTERLDKYNVWAMVSGGGTTGQAEALALAIAKALCVHEPALKNPLRRAGCITRDPRKVERKKHGHVKARKMPTWVKR